MTRLLFILTLAFMTFAAQAADSSQFEPPLEGPIVAVTPAEQDAIHLHEVRSGETRVLSFGVGEHHVWDFSPDGCRLLFTVDRSGQGLPTLYTANLDGSDMQEMVTYDALPADAWGVWEPDWASKGTIAFTMIQDTPDAEEREHYIAYVDGTAASNAEFYSVTGREFTPTWSPDGAWLAYVSYDERVPGADIYSTAVPTSEASTPIPEDELNLLNEADMWVVSADGETKYRLTDFKTGSVRSPRWSPDGELIGFIYSPSPNNDTFWMIANNPDAIPTQLSSQWNLTLDHTWLPDSSAMLASVRDFREVQENHLWRIPLLGNADNTATQYLEDAGYTQLAGSLSHTDFPRFGPYGRYLAFRNVYALAVLDTQTGDLQRFDQDAPGNTPPIWTPDSFNGEQACRQADG